MPDPTAALYVRLPHAEFDKLDRAAEALRTNKKTLVTTLVSHYVDPDSAAGLDRLRDNLVAAQRRVTVELPEQGVTVGHHAFTPAPRPDVLTPGAGRRAAPGDRGGGRRARRGGDAPGPQDRRALALLAPGADRVARRRLTAFARRERATRACRRPAS